MKKIISIILLGIACNSFVYSQPNCPNDSTGLILISDLGSTLYLGYQGGLYPGGSNSRPSTHLNTGITLANQITPRDTAGNKVFVSLCKAK